MPKANPDALYHFTSTSGLVGILHTKHIALSESNLNIREGNCGIVWLTSSPEPVNHGLKFNDSIPSEHDKTCVRIALQYKSTFRHWDAWSDDKGMDAAYKQHLIRSANGEESHKTWYISEGVIPIDDILEIENLSTGERVSVAEVVERLDDSDIPKVHFHSEIDAYIASQPAHLQVLLLNVRMAIKEALPDATEKISWQMPTYWQGHNLIHFAAQKSHLGIYPGEEAMKHFAPRLSDYKTSKGAVQFPYQSFGPEQLSLIAEIAAWCGNAHRKGPS